MSYLDFILVSSVLGFALISVLGLVFKKSVWRFNPASFIAILVFYIFFWIGDAISIHSGYYSFDSAYLSGSWIGGIPLEDHIAGIFGLVLVRCLFNFFENGSNSVN